MKILLFEARSFSTIRTVLGLGLVVVACLSWSATAEADISLVPDADARLANDANRNSGSAVGGSDQWEVRWREVPGSFRIRIGYVRWDITGIDPSLFPSATISGFFTDTGRNGGGTWDVYGLKDSVTSSGGIQGNDWDESTINYSNAAGVDNNAPQDTFAFTSDVDLLGSINFDGDDTVPLDFSSDPATLDLNDFLNADTDGLVTFLFMDSDFTDTEWRIHSKEDGTLPEGHGPTTLNFFEGVGTPGDLDNDLDVDGQDFLLAQEDGAAAVATWQANYPNALSGITAVPEPGTCGLVLLAVSIAGLSLRQRQ